ncbi:MAG TPA: AI-2E family transporter [Isosphaeraceae bacterium]|jgi:predicted PurR-regulated permease PerM|nr:AI-2E family transporter [Isosphaeraceae bacterium]
MASRRDRFSWDHPVIITFLIIAVVAAMALAAEVLKPLALAVLLSFALAPVARFLEHRGLPRFPAVASTVVLSLGLLGGVSYVVGQQLFDLAEELPKNQRRIVDKIRSMRPAPNKKFEKVQEAGKQIAEEIATPPKAEDVTNVRIVNESTWHERLGTAVGAPLEYLGTGAFVLILVLFLMMNRQDLRDRIIQLFGQRRLTLTTRTLDEADQRISRYLATFATVNSTYGLIIGLGLWAFGVKYAILWGFLAAVFRFIPYVGPAAAFVLPLAYSIATADGWRQPLEVAALFGVVETLANSFLEPIIYGRSTGVSALGLLVAAMFWTWLWGILGLLLSTPMTVCLAVLGKYVPSLSFFATLLGEDSELSPAVRFYQRLLALDQDGATEVVDEELKRRPPAEVVDEVLVPALSRAERDAAHDELDDREIAFIWRVVGDIIDDVGDLPEGLEPTATAGAKVVGVATNDEADALVLRMLGRLLAPSGCAFEILGEADSPLKLAERLTELDPAVVVLSHLPPSGLTPARYLVRRLRARFPKLPLVVGRWGEAGDSAGAAERLVEVGASRVVFSIADARDRVLTLIAPETTADGPVPQPAGAAR